MSIIGRNLDKSERMVAFQWNSGAYGMSLMPDQQLIPTGSTLTMLMVPFNSVISSGMLAAYGVSGAPQLSLRVNRFIGGATNYAIGISNMVVTGFGTSGCQGFSGLPAPGSTLLNLKAGDILFMTTSVANTAIQNLIMELVLRKTDEIVIYNRGNN